MIKYEPAPDLNARIRDIIRVLKMKHLDPERVICARSTGSAASRILARVHGLAKVMQLVLGVRSVYAIEVISETFDKLTEEDRVKTLIHELLHIPKAFGGGLLSHKRFVTSRKVEKAYKTYVDAKTQRQVEINLDSTT